MSGTIIRDGTGSHRAAKVDIENKLLTRAVTVSEFGHNSLDEEAGYGAHLQHTFVAADTSEELAQWQQEQQDEWEDEGLI